MKAFVHVVFVALGAFVLLSCNKGNEEKSAQQTSAAVNMQAQQPYDEKRGLLESEKNTISIFQQAAPLVVYVHRIQYRRQLFTFERAETGAGSGFLWGTDGHIVTNYHVVQGADNIAITFANGKTKKAKVVNVFQKKDIAVLKVELDDSVRPKQALELADSSKLQVGQKTIAIGNPYGLSHTLTTGVISAIGRAVGGIGGVKIRDMIQTDAAVNRGNSGGPLLDSQGRLIGMNTQIISSSGDSAGIGFAVPANTIKRIVGQIIKFGYVKQPEIGVSVVPDQFAYQVGIKGVIILQVLPGSEAAAAGLRGMQRDDFGNIIIGDVIVAIDDNPVQNFDDLYASLENRKEGEEIAITYLRDGRKSTARLKLKVYSR